MLLNKLECFCSVLFWKKMILAASFKAILLSEEVFAVHGNINLCNRTLIRYWRTLVKAQCVAFSHGACNVQSNISRTESEAVYPLRSLVAVCQSQSSIWLHLQLGSCRYSLSLCIISLSVLGEKHRHMSI